MWSCVHIISTQRIAAQQIVFLELQNLVTFRILRASISILPTAMFRKVNSLAIVVLFVFRRLIYINSVAFHGCKGIVGLLDCLACMTSRSCLRFEQIFASRMRLATDPISYLSVDCILVYKAFSCRRRSSTMTWRTVQDQIGASRLIVYWILLI